MAPPSHQWAFGSLRGSWQGMVRARSPLPAPRPPCALPRGPTPRACLTKKRGVKRVCPVNGIFLQEAGVGEAAFDHPAARCSGIQHRAPLCAGQRHGHQPRVGPPPHRRDRQALPPGTAPRRCDLPRAPRAGTRQRLHSPGGITPPPRLAAGRHLLSSAGQPTPTTPLHSRASCHLPEAWLLGTAH